MEGVMPSRKKRSSACKNLNMVDVFSMRPALGCDGDLL